MFYVHQLWPQSFAKICLPIIAVCWTFSYWCPMMSIVSQPGRQSSWPNWPGRLCALFLVNQVLPISIILTTDGVLRDLLSAIACSKRFISSVVWHYQSKDNKPDDYIVISIYWSKYYDFHYLSHNNTFKYYEMLHLFSIFIALKLLQ